MEIRKAAIFLATYNKNEGLPNVLVSIDRQQTSFPVEVCAIDDHSELDPYPLYKKYLTKIPFNYKRLDTHVGFEYSQSLCLDLLSSDVDAIILQSSDVIHGSSFMVQRLCDELEPKQAVMPEVRNISVSPTLHHTMEQDLFKYCDEAVIQNQLFVDDFGNFNGDFSFYAGPRQPKPKIRWYFFLGAILKEDLLRTCYPQDCFDVSVSNSMRRLGYTVKYIDDVIGIHQRHKRS